jgi:hypothetical protein
MSLHEPSYNFIDIFFGHTHGDQFSVRHNFMCASPLADFGQIKIYYANNATNINADTAVTTSWIGPSITPLTNLNSGFRVYEVDSAVSAANCSRLACWLISLLLTDIRNSRCAHVSLLGWLAQKRVCEANDLM